VHGCQGTQAQPIADFFKRRRVAIALDEILEEVVNLPLSLCNCHTSEILTNQRRIINRNLAKGTIFYNGRYFLPILPP
jgi:hypothetical protein